MRRVARTLPRKAAARRPRWHTDGSRSLAAERMRSERLPEGWYDIRSGAAGYAPIVGAFGALSVPAIVFLFTAPPRPTAQHAPVVALAGGLLIVAVIGSLAGAIGLAAIGAEQDATANLVPAAMFLAVAVSISLVAVLAAFEALATLYLPGSGSTKLLFAVITGAGGVAGSFFTGLSVADSWHTGPTWGRESWRRGQWITSRPQAYRWAEGTATIGGTPALIGILLRVLGVKIGLTTANANWLVGVALALSMTAIALGMLRTRHPVDGAQKGLRQWEAVASTFAISCYALALIIFLP
jgi:hypothetical protein